MCIKTCRPGNLGLNEPPIGLTEDLFKEAVQMTHFEHQNVMKLIGISIDVKQNPELVMPLMELGDLQKFLQDPVNRLTYPQVRNQLVHSDDLSLTIIVGYKIDGKCISWNGISSFKKYHPQGFGSKKLSS